MKRLVPAKRLVLTGALCATLALSTAACSDDESPEEAATSAATELCGDIDDLQADIAKLTGLDPASATKEQVQDAYGDIRDDWNDAKEHITALSSAKEDAVTGAADGLKRAYEDIPDGTPVPEILTRLKPELEKLVDSVTQGSSDLKCP
ncbi:hypothetical protein [Streptomyces sp. Da 82-17]|uniref:hypothetical protein n=1 Tax=Streptomyces sp. Da 82-17 TaxID=3377116 RepID=UPI0038D4A3C0